MQKEISPRLQSVDTSKPRVFWYVLRSHEYTKQEELLVYNKFIVPLLDTYLFGGFIKEKFEMAHGDVVIGHYETHVIVDVKKHGNQIRIDECAITPPQCWWCWYSSNIAGLMELNALLFDPKKINLSVNDRNIAWSCGASRASYGYHPLTHGYYALIRTYFSEYDFRGFFNTPFDGNEYDGILIEYEIFSDSLSVWEYKDGKRYVIKMIPVKYDQEKKRKKDWAHAITRMVDSFLGVFHETTDCLKDKNT